MPFRLIIWEVSPNTVANYSNFICYIFVVPLLILTMDLRTAYAQLSQYIVRPGDNCRRIAINKYGSEEYISLIHDNNPLGPTPHRLTPGLVLWLPPKPDALPKQVATLTFRRNQVDTFTPAQHVGTVGERLSQGHKVSTLGASSAELVFADETRLQLGEHSLIVLLGKSAGTSRSTSSADTVLLHGSLRAHLAQLAGSDHPTSDLPLKTPSARVRLGRGQALVHVDARQTTRLAVHQGLSSLESAGRSVRVPSGFGSRADRGRHPTPPRPLPSAPEWVAAPDLLVTLGAALDVHAAYRPGRAGPPATQFHIQIARDAQFNDLLLDTRVPARTLQVDMRQLVPGDYALRVSGIDADDFEGPSSPVWSLRIAAIPIRPSAGSVLLDVPAGLVCRIGAEPIHRAGTTVTVETWADTQLYCARTDPPSRWAALSLPAVEPPPQSLVQARLPPLAPAPQPRPKPAQPPLHPAPHAPVHPPVRLRYAGAVIAGSHLAPTRPENTINTELGLARYMPLAYGALRFSFRVSHEYHRFLDPSSALCQGISCQTSASSPVPIMSDHHTLGISLPIFYEATVPIPHLCLYTGLSPWLVFNLPITEPEPIPRVGIGVAGHIGLGILNHRSALFFELRYRQIEYLGAVSENFSASGLSLFAGYQFPLGS